MLGAARRPTGSQSTAISSYGSSSGGMQRSDTRKRRPDHSGSKLLTSAENQLMFDILGQNRISLSAAVVQLLKASGGKWQHVHVGVVSLVKDYDRKLYTLILFDIYNGQKLWEQVLYKNFSAKTYANCRKLLSFESDDYVYGLNFSDEHEAIDLKYHLDKRREAETGQRDNRATMRPAQAPYQPPQQQKFQSPGFTDVGSTPHFSVQQAPPPAATNNKKKGKDKKKGVKIRKEDIGYPTNFEHKAHLGWDTEGGFSQRVDSSEPLDNSVIELLKVAGQNPDIMSREELDFAHKFIDKYQKTGPPPTVPAPSYPTIQKNGQSGQQKGGFTLTPVSHQQAIRHPTSAPAQSHYSYQAAQQHQYNTMSHHVDSTPRPPPAPARDSSMYMTRQQQQTPVRPPPMERPPPPSFEKPQAYHPPSTITSIPPAPPAMPQQSASRPGPPPPPPPPPNQAAKPVKVTPSNVPAAPPPPPALGQIPAAPPPPPMSNGSAGDNDRSNLLAQIQAGTKLKHVNAPVEKSGSALGKVASTDSRGQMMDQIKQGTQLKHVDPSENDNRKSVPNVNEIGGIAGALARALEERRINMNISDDSDNSDEDEDEWNDD